jgi:hypothetical protein
MPLSGMNTVDRVRETAADVVWALHENGSKFARRIALGVTCVAMLFAGAALSMLAGGQGAASTRVETRITLRTVTVKGSPRTVTIAQKPRTVSAAAVADTPRDPATRVVVTRPGRTSTIMVAGSGSVVTGPGVTRTHTVTAVHTVTLPATTVEVTQTQTRTVTQTQTVTQTATVTETECPGKSCH